jgi:hypothetical protein
MPIVERDPWRAQYFEGIVCPDDIVIPTDDEHAYELYAEHRWIYNKLLIADSQNVAGAPHGVPSPDYPVFSKPIYNMQGMGVGGRIIDDEAALDAHLTAGHMWMALQNGEHVSTDVVVIGGEAQWWRHAVGATLSGGMFDYWTVAAAERPALETYCGAWLHEHLRGYTGAVNMETIGGCIIEVHLRFADQWPDLYGRGWLDAIVDLYAKRRWRFSDAQRRDGYSVVLFGSHGVPYRWPAADLIEDIRKRDQVQSVQITFHADRPPERHAMPPGGFRLAIVNCWDLDIGLRAREELALGFWTAQDLSPMVSS